MMLVITNTSPILLLIVMSLLIGLTNGLSGFANQATLYIQSPPGEIAVAAGLLRTSGNLAAIFSSSIIGLTFGAVATDVGFHELALVLVEVIAQGQRELLRRQDLAGAMRRTVVRATATLRARVEVEHALPRQVRRARGADG